MIKAIKYLVILFAGCTCLNAQDVQSELSLISNAYKINSKLTMNIEYKMYETYTSNQAIDIKKGFYRKLNKLYHNKIAGIENIINGNYAIYIDSIEKKIAISKDIPSNLEKQYMMVDYESSLKKFKNIEPLKTGNNKIRGFRFWFKDDDQQLTYYELYYFNETHLIQRINLFYNFPISFDEDKKDAEGTIPRMEIVFTNIDVHPTFTEKDFQTEQFVKGSGKSYTASQKYKGYKVSVL